MSAPDLASFLASLRNHKSDVLAQHLQALLKHRQIWGARRCAVAMAHLLIKVVAEFKPKDAADLLARVQAVGRELVKAQPNELTIGNITRRVLGLVREASESGKKESLALCQSITIDADPKSIGSVKEDVLEGLRELLDELDQADKQIADSSLEYIHPQDVVLVYGRSLTIQKFLLDAAKKRRFTVIQVEGHPNQHDSVQETLAKGAARSTDDVAGVESRLKPLPAAGVEVIYVPDSNIFAAMPRVSKVILSAQGIFADGGSMVSSGSSLVAKAARFHRVPVLVTGAVYRLSPAFHFDDEAITSENEPSKAIPFSDGGLVDHVEVINGTRDLLLPQDTTLIITNIGGFSPAYIGRIACDHYRAQDTVL